MPLLGCDECVHASFSILRRFCPGTDFLVRSPRSRRQRLEERVPSVFHRCGACARWSLLSATAASGRGASPRRLRRRRILLFHGARTAATSVSFPHSCPLKLDLDFRAGRLLDSSSAREPVQRVLLAWRTRPADQGSDRERRAELFQAIMVSPRLEVRAPTPPAKPQDYHRRGLPPRLLYHARSRPRRPGSTREDPEILMIETVPIRAAREGGW